MRKIDVIILTPEAADTVGVWALAYFCWKDKTMDVAKKVHNHKDVIYLLPNKGIRKKGAWGLWHCE